MQLLTIPEADYHQASAEGRYLSSHKLATFRRCPLEYQKLIAGEMPDYEKQAYVDGRALHCLLLEGQEEYLRRFTTDAPINEKTGKPFGVDSIKYQTWAAEMREQGKEPVAPHDEFTVSRMAMAVRMHDIAAELLAEGLPEQTVRTEMHDEPVQIRMDWIRVGQYVVDLKKTADLDRFAYDAKRFRYGHQFAFYQEAIVAAGGERLPFMVVAVEDKEPYRVGVWSVPQGVMDMARLDNERAIRELQACRESGVFCTRYEDIRELIEI